MVDGAIRHGTKMAVEADYVDTHGQSEIGFGITRLLGFDLLPRIKRINKVKLYRPAAGKPDCGPGSGDDAPDPVDRSANSDRPMNPSMPSSAGITASRTCAIPASTDDGSAWKVVPRA